MNPYVNYYANQVGSGLPAFAGVRYQRGHGFFGRIFSNVGSFLKQLLPSVGKRILPSAVGLAQDVLAGENVKQSALSRLKEAGKSAADETLGQLKTKLSGSGRKRRRRRSASTARNKKRKVATVVYKKGRRRRRKRVPEYLT